MVQDKTLLGPATLLITVGGWAFGEFLSSILPTWLLGGIGALGLIAGICLTLAAYLPEGTVERSPLRSIRHWLVGTESRASAPDISVSGTQNVVAVNPVNSQTAHTIINQAPRPTIRELDYAISNGTHRKRILVETPYPISELIVVAWGSGISAIEIGPERTGMSMSGWTGVRSDRAFTSAHNAHGTYSIVVNKADDEPLQFQFSVDNEIR